MCAFGNKSLGHFGDEGVQPERGALKRVFKHKAYLRLEVGGGLPIVCCGNTLWCC